MAFLPQNSYWEKSFVSNARFGLHNTFWKLYITNKTFFPVGILLAMSSDELSEMRASCDTDIIPNSDISTQNIIAGTRRTRRYLRKRE